MAIEIPQAEFDQRIKRIQAELAKRGLDALITFGNEAEQQNVRWLSDYWPAFETAGVLIPVEGEAVLIIGPESLTFAQSRSRLPKIRQLLAYRESAEPEYPGLVLPSFKDVLDEVSGGKGVKKLGMVGWSFTTIPVYEGLNEAMRGGELVRADDIVIGLRQVKSEAEIACMREGYRISAIALKACLDEMRPGMTELQVCGIAQREIYANGAEYEGHPLYVLSGKHSSHAIGRPAQRKIERGQIIQLDIGARVGGYSSSIGRAVSFGPLPTEQKALLQMALDAENKTIELIHAGASAGGISREIAKYVSDRGFAETMIYGPCHGTGLMEVEHPWMETSSTYDLLENMTFEVDSYLHTSDYGGRFEDAVRVTKDGAEEFSNYRRELITL